MRSLFLTCILALGVAVSGCSGGPAQVAVPNLPQSMPVDPPGGSLLLTSNTYAGDALHKMLLLRMGSGGGILTTNLVNLHDFNDTSAFGRVAAQQVGSRISQYGFRVIEARLAASMTMNAQGEFMLTRETARLLESTYDANAVMVGCYSAQGGRVYVSLRVVRLSDNAIMAAYEYYLPREGDISRLLADSSTRGGSDNVWRRYNARERAFAPGAGAATPKSAVTSGAKTGGTKTGGAVPQKSASAKSAPAKTASGTTPAVAVPRYVDPAKPAPQPVKRAAVTPKPAPAPAAAPAPAVTGAPPASVPVEKDAPAPAS
ncbi:hypothetical protein LJC26_08470 [Desulfovibrio sp. OttesenSCG-928-O18]|nr:hypothetical protein [Desulfovibrio sp. OttesenSCG-928-O18]